MGIGLAENLLHWREGRERERERKEKECESEEVYRDNIQSVSHYIVTNMSQWTTPQHMLARKEEKHQESNLMFNQFYTHSNLPTATHVCNSPNYSEISDTVWSVCPAAYPTPLKNRQKINTVMLGEKADTAPNIPFRVRATMRTNFRPRMSANPPQV